MHHWPRRHLVLAASGVLLAIALSGNALALAALDVYQRGGAPAVSRMGIECRFTPSCSRYAEAVIARDGLAAGGWRALRRVARCHPWTPRGTVDEP